MPSTTWQQDLLSGLNQACHLDDSDPSNDNCQNTSGVRTQTIAAHPTDQTEILKAYQLFSDAYYTQEKTPAESVAAMGLGTATPSGTTSAVSALQSEYHSKNPIILLRRRCQKLHQEYKRADISLDDAHAKFEETYELLKPYAALTDQADLFEEEYRALANEDMGIKRYWGVLSYYDAQQYDTAMGFVGALTHTLIDGPAFGYFAPGLYFEKTDVGQLTPWELRRVSRGKFFENNAIAFSMALPSVTNVDRFFGLPPMGAADFRAYKGPLNGSTVAYYFNFLGDWGMADTAANVEKWRLQHFGGYYLGPWTPQLNGATDVFQGMVYSDQSRLARADIDATHALLWGASGTVCSQAMGDEIQAFKLNHPEYNYTDSSADNYKSDDEIAAMICASEQAGIDQAFFGGEQKMQLYTEPRLDSAATNNALGRNVAWLDPKVKNGLGWAIGTSVAQPWLNQGWSMIQGRSFNGEQLGVDYRREVQAGAETVLSAGHFEDLIPVWGDVNEQASKWRLGPQASFMGSDLVFREQFSLTNVEFFVWAGSTFGESLKEGGFGINEGALWHDASGMSGIDAWQYRAPGIAGMGIHAARIACTADLLYGSNNQGICFSSIGKDGQTTSFTPEQVAEIRAEYREDPGAWLVSETAPHVTFGTFFTLSALGVDTTIDLGRASLDLGSSAGTLAVTLPPDRRGWKPTVGITPWVVDEIPGASVTVLKK